MTMKRPAGRILRRNGWRAAFRGTAWPWAAWGLVIVAFLLAALAPFLANNHAHDPRGRRKADLPRLPQPGADRVALSYFRAARGNRLRGAPPLVRATGPRTPYRPGPHVSDRPPARARACLQRSDQRPHAARHVQAHAAHSLVAHGNLARPTRRPGLEASLRHRFDRPRRGRAAAPRRAHFALHRLRLAAHLAGLRRDVSARWPATTGAGSTSPSAASSR